MINNIGRPTRRQAFGRRIRTARQDQNRAQQSVADACGKSQNWVSRLERGVFVYLPRADDLYLLALDLEIPLAELLELTGHLVWRQGDEGYLEAVLSKLRRRGLRGVA